MPLLTCRSPPRTNTIQHTPHVPTHILLGSKIKLIRVPGCLTEDPSNPLATSTLCMADAMAMASTPILITVVFIMVALIALVFVLIAVLVFLIAAMMVLVITEGLDLLPAVVMALLLTTGTVLAALEGLITDGAVNLGLEGSWVWRQCAPQRPQRLCTGLLTVAGTGEVNAS